MQEFSPRQIVAHKLDLAFWSTYRALNAAAGAGGMDSIEEDLSSILLALQAMQETVSHPLTQGLRTRPRAVTVA